MLKEAQDDRTSSKGNGKSILRTMLADNGAELANVQKAYGCMLSREQGDGWLAPLWERRVENDALDYGTRVRMARGGCLRASGVFNDRFNQHFKGTPFEFVDMNDEVLLRLLGAKLCCLKPFFCGGSRSKFNKLPGEEAVRRLMESGFSQLVHFWADEFETATSVRNERQHASFSRKVCRGGKAGAHASI